MASWWYTALFGVVLIGAIVAVMRLTTDARRFARCAALVSLG